jgi:photosystem II biogenesis protein Psp29
VIIPYLLQCRSLQPQNVAIMQPRRVQTARRMVVVQVSAAANPPTVADAKAKFLQVFNKPLPSLYSTVVLELLVQQHLYRWNANYVYTPVMALGICSVFDQILQGLPEEEQTAVFNAYINALEESPEQYRKDAAMLEELAKSAGSVDDLVPSSSGNDAQKLMAEIADKVASGKFLYTKFFAVGLFRVLELAGAKDPKALGSLVEGLGIPLERVNADLVTYKGILSRLKAAKEIMKEFIEREKKKQAEREAAKAEKQQASA